MYAIIHALIVSLFNGYAFFKKFVEPRPLALSARILHDNTSPAPFHMCTVPITTVPEKQEEGKLGESAVFMIQDQMFTGLLLVAKAVYLLFLTTPSVAQGKT